MAKFKKKPVEIEALQYTGDNIDKIWELFGSKFIFDPTVNKPEALMIETLEGIMDCPVGHYIIKGVKDEIYCCDPEVFKMSYEQIDW